MISEAFDESNYVNDDIESIRRSRDAMEKTLLEREADCKSLLKQMAQQDEFIKKITAKNNQLFIKCDVLDKLLFRLIENR